MLAAPVVKIGEEQGAAGDEAVGEQADSAHDLHPNLCGEEGGGLGPAVMQGLPEEAEGQWRDCKKTGPKSSDPQAHCSPACCSNWPNVLEASAEAPASLLAPLPLTCSGFSSGSGGGSRSSMGSSHTCAAVRD